MGNKFHFFLLKFVENKKIHPVLCVCFFPLQLMGSTIYMGLLLSTKAGITWYERWPRPRPTAINYVGSATWKTLGEEPLKCNEGHWNT